MASLGKLLPLPIQDIKDWPYSIQDWLRRLQAFLNGLITIVSGLVLESAVISERLDAIEEEIEVNNETLSQMLVEMQITNMYLHQLPYYLNEGKGFSTKDDPEKLRNDLTLGEK